MVKELIKHVNKAKQYKDKEGKMRNTTNYYLVMDNGTNICIKPAFKRDYPKLDVLARVVVKDK